MRRTHAPSILAVLFSAALVAGPIIGMTLWYLAELSDQIRAAGMPL